MPPFDANAYFQSIANQESIAPTSNPFSKQSRLESAAARKRAALSESVARKQQELPGVVASFVVGSNRLLQGVGTIQGLTTGDMDNWARQQGKRTADRYEDLKPLSLREAQEGRHAAVEAADGEFAKFGTAIWETMADPELFTSLLAEQIPNFIPGGAAGRVVGAVTGVAGAATATAIGVGAAQQGADVAGGVYDDMMAFPDHVWEANDEYTALKELHGADEAKKTLSRRQASIAGSLSAGVSAITQRGPGATIERALAGSAKTTAGSLIGGVARGFAGEAAQEIAEEGSGQILGNIAKSDVDPTQDITEGVGEASGLGAIGGGVFGGVAGLAGGAKERATKILDERQEILTKNETINGLTKDAIESGNVDELITDPDSETYNPEQAAKGLAGHVLNEKTTDEAREESTAKLKEVLTTQDDKVAALQAESNKLVLTDTESMSKRELKAHNKKIDKVFSDLDQATAVSERMSGFRDLPSMVNAPTDEEIDALVETAQSEEASPEQSKAADDVITLMMQSPVAVNEAQVKRLQESPSLNEEQQAFLLNFSEAHAQINALNTLKDTTSDITKGRDGFKGINQYESDIAAAIRNEDQPAATKEFTALQAFSADHQAKETAFKEGQALAATLPPLGIAYAIRDQRLTSGWAVVGKADGSKPFDGWNQKRNGGFEFHNTKKGIEAATTLMERIDIENAALQAAEKQHQSAISLAFGTSTATANETKAPPANDVPIEAYDESEVAGQTTKSAPVTAVADPAPVADMSVEEIMEALSDVANSETGKINRAKLSEELEDIVMEQKNAPEAMRQLEKDTLAYHEQQREEAESVDEVQETKAIEELTNEIKYAQSQRRDIKSTIGRANGRATERQLNAITQWGKGIQRAKAQLKELGVSVADIKAIINQPLGRVSNKKTRTNKEVLERNILLHEKQLKEEGWTDSERRHISELLDKAKKRLVIETKAVEELDEDEVPPTKENEAETVEPTKAEETATEEASTEEEATEDNDGTVDEEVDTAKQTSTAGVLSIFEGQERLEGNLTKEQLQDPDINLVGGYFYQPAAQEGDTANPLVAVKDFMTSIFEEGFSPKAILDFLPDRTELKDGELSLVQNFVAYFGEWAPIIADNINKAEVRPKVRHLDLMQSFSGKVDENLQTAIALTAYLYIAENSEGKGDNSDRELKGMLGLGNTDWIPTELRDRFQYAGTLESTFVEMLGKEARNTLSLLPVKNSPKDISVDLELGLGAHVYALLLRSGFLEVNNLVLPQVENTQSATIADFNASQEAKEIAAEEEIGTRMRRELPKSVFVRIARDKDNVADEDSLDIATGNKEGGKILNDLFSVTSALIPPASEPGQFNQESVKGLGVPSTQQEIGKEFSKEPHKFRKDMQRVRQALSNALNEYVVGIRDRTGEWVHEAKAKSNEARNDNLRLQLRRMQEFEESNGDAPMYFEYDFWKQGRAGLRSNVINPATSKDVQRHNIYMESARTTIDAGVPGTTLNNFKLAIGLGMGLDVDKRRPVTSLAKVEKLMNEPAIKRAIVALNNIEEGKQLSPADQEAIKAAVDIGEANTYSLDALVNWAAYLNADSNTESTKFDTDIMFEVDGVANGVALVMLQYGMMTPELGAKFGFYTEEQKFDNYPEWREMSGEEDVYETDASQSNRLMGQTEVDMIQNSDGMIDVSRPTIKTPVQSLAFGSGVTNSVQSMAEDVIAKFYDKLEEVANGPLTNAESRAKVRKLTESINGLLQKSNELPPLDFGPPNRRVTPKVRLLSVPTNAKEAMATTLSFNQEKALINAFTRTVGTPITDTLKESYGGMIGAREYVTKASTATHARYKAAYDYLYQLAVDAKVESGELAVGNVSKENAEKGKKGKPIQELTDTDIADIERTLSTIFPVFHSYFSKQDGELFSGIPLSKTDNTKVDRNSSTYRQEVRVGLPAKRGDAKATNTIKVSGSKRESTDSGVAATVLGAHSSDAGNAHSSVAEVPSINVHDALLMGIARMQAAGEALNRNTYQVLMDYNLPTEVVEALQRSFDGEAALVAAYPGLQKVFDDVMFGPDYDRQLVTRELLSAARTVVTQTEARKFRYLSQVATVNQYAFTDGTYAVTDEQRAEALNRAQAAENKLAGLDAPTEKAKTLTEQPVVVPPPMPEDTPWGVTGEAIVSVESEIVTLLQENNGSTAQPIMKKLAAMIKAGMNKENETTSKFRLELLRSLYHSVNPNTKLHMVSAHTPGNAAPNPPELLASRAVYVADGKGNHDIVIKGPEFTTAGATAEVIVHELTHAATAQAIEKYKDVPTGDGLSKKDLEVWTAVKTLQMVHNQAAEYIRENGLEAKYSIAVKNTHELVAHGMTNVGFQDDVLSKIHIPLTDAHSSRLSQLVDLSGMRVFVDALTTIIFGDKASETQRNGLGVLIASTEVIMGANVKTTPGPSLVTTMETDAPRAFTTEQIYEGLGVYGNAVVLSPTHDNHLRNVLDTIVKVVYGPTGALRPSAERQAPAKAEDVFLESLRTGVAPFASKLTAELPMTDQEAFVAESAELTIRAGLNTKSATLNRNELQKIRVLAKKHVTVDKLYDGDWSLASKADKDTAQRMHDIIFKAEANTAGGSDYLSQFAAAALTYKPLRDQLALIRTPVNNANYRDQTILGAIHLFFERLMESYVAYMTGTHQGQTAQQQVMQLATNLATIEAKEKARIQRIQGTPDSIINATSTKISEGVRAGIESAGNSRFFKENRVKTVRAIGTIISTVAGDRAEEFTANFNRVMDQDSRSRLGPMREIMNEIRNGRPAMEVMNDLLVLSNDHEQSRKRIKEDVTRYLLEAFGTKLNKEQSTALTRAVIRTDMSSLIVNHSLADIEQMLSDPATLDAAIKTYEQQLTGKNAKYYTASAKGLGYFLATGQVKVQNLMMNAHNIAFLANTSELGSVTDIEGDAAAAIIDPLTTLYALRYTSGNYKSSVANLMRDEALRGKGKNGIDLLLKTQVDMKKQSKAKLFEGKDALMMKGYVKDIYNPHIQVLATNAKKGKDLVAAGYVQVGTQELGQDLADPTAETRFLYKIRDKGLSPTVTGILQNTGRQAAGSTVHGDVMDAVTGDINQGSAKRNRYVADKRRTKISNMFNTPSSFDPSKQGGNNLMAPVINEAGQAANYRYLMEENTKDVVMERDNRFEEVMGSTAASIFDKANNIDLAIQSIDATKAQYDDDYLNNESAYIDVSENNPDPVVRERYRLLPDETKRYIRKVFGRNGMHVRNDMYNITMGFRKFSMGNAFAKSALDRGIIENALVTVLEHIPVGWDSETGKPKLMGQKAALRVVQAENVWQEIVRMVKDNYVIKSLFTFLGNEMSNATLLWLQGVPIHEIIQGKAVAFRATVDYMGDRRRHDELSRKVEVGYITGQAKTDAEQEIIELNERMQRSPVKDLIDAGMYQTLVEDLDQEEDIYSYKSRLNSWTEEKTTWVNPTVKHVVKKYVLLTHDTDIYKALNKATQMSDFTSRYVMYKHLTERKNKPMSPEAAIREARKSFVNYDTPTHISLQYLNDMGLLWFTKYYLRIQGVILQLIRDNPLRAIALTGFDFFTDISDILASGAFQNSPLNFGMGAVEIFESTGQIVTINAVM